MFVGDLDGQPRGEHLDRVVDRSGVSKLGENQQADIVERFVADDRLLGDRTHPTRPFTNLLPVRRAGKVGLATGGVVTFGHGDPVGEDWLRFLRTGGGKREKETRQMINRTPPRVA